MSNDDSELRTALATLARGEGDGAHPEAGELVAYSAGELAVDDETRVRRHLEGCRECVALARDLALARDEAATRDGAASAATPVDFELEAAWRALRPRLAAEAAGEPAAGEAAGEAAGDRGAAAPPWAQLLAAALALVVVGLGVFSWRLHSTTGDLRRTVAELEAPRGDLPILYFDAVTRAGDDDTPAVPAGATSFALIVTPPSAPVLERYAVEIQGSPGDVVWRGDDLVASEYGTLRLLLTRRLLPAGDYRLVLSGDGETLARYSLSVR